MEELKRLLDKTLNNTLINCIISGKKNKLSNVDKIKIRQVVIKENSLFQITEYTGTKVIHQNKNASETKEYICHKLLQEFKQCQIKSENVEATVLVSSKGKITIKEKAAAYVVNANELIHNRKKEYLLPEGVPVPFLIDLGVMGKDGKIISKQYDKYRQINRFLEFIKDILPELNKNKTINILDFGCGKSYLTFAMYYYLKEINGYDIRITGLDLKKDVIEKCNNLAKKYNYSDLVFLCGDVAKYDEKDEIDMMVTLHACDTATDYAIAKAVKWKASVILSVPCCQHEFNKTMACDDIAGALSFGIIKERTAALMTDGIRGCILDAVGYDTQLLEFIDIEHTPKNILIRASKSNNKNRKHTKEECKNMLDNINVSSTLYNLLFSE